MTEPFTVVVSLSHPLPDVSYVQRVNVYSIDVSAII